MENRNMEMMSKKLKFQRKAIKLLPYGIGTSIRVLDRQQYIDITGAEIIEVVECDACRESLGTSDTRDIRFLSIYGNIHANDAGGLIGNGNWDEHGVPVSHYCPECLIKEIQGWVKKSNGDVKLQELERR